MRDVQEAIDEITGAVRTETGVPGLAACVMRSDARWFSASGTARAGTQIPISSTARFDVSCLMKFFLSVATLKLQAKDEISLQTDIVDFLPELAPSRGIRLIHLMSHVSGYHGLDITDMAVRWNSNWNTFTERFRGAPQLFAPGEVFNYEHSEHVILGEALRRLLHRAPLALVLALLLGPAGVQLRKAGEAPTGISPHSYSPQRGGYVPVRLAPFGAFWEASLPALTITLDDAASAIHAALADRTILEDLRTPLVELPDMARSEPRAEQPPHQFSAACGLYGPDILGHNGSMAGQTMGFRADLRTGALVVVGVNAYSAHARDAALRRMLQFLGDRVDKAPETALSPSDPLYYAHHQIFGDLTLAELPGTYLGSYLGQVVVARDGSDLEIVVGPPGNRQSSFHIFARGDRYIIRKVPVALRFQRGADGHPTLFLGVHAYKAQRSAGR